MNEQKLFEKNLAYWSKLAPEDSKELKKCNSNSIEFGLTKEGKPNLKTMFNGNEYTFHSNEDPIREALEWLSTIDLRDIEVLFIYGVGLGYYYDVLADWLHSDKQRRLIFIEDNLEVIKRLFETEQAEKLITDHQVELIYIKDFKQDLKKFEGVVNRLGHKKFKITGLEHYLHVKGANVMIASTILNYLMSLKDILTREFYSFGKNFYTNFYLNLSLLVKSYFGNEMYGSFKGVPAIICGGGPSLKKNISLLKTLKDRALIFSGSTSTNVLNAAGINPHFGVAMDPNKDQLHRILTNTAYQIPHFFHNRVNSHALNAIQGDHLYINSGHNHAIAKWVEEQLGLKGAALNEGFNVVNFSLAIAQALGCHPIVTVGVDLAYTDFESYAPVLDKHAFFEDTVMFKTKTNEEELISRQDIYGKPTLTLWKWLLESTWYSQFVVQNPETLLINATEGGIGFPGIKNMSLQEVSSEYFKEVFDLDGIIHGEIQSSPMPKTASYELLKGVFKTLEEGLQECKVRCKQIEELFLNISKDPTKQSEDSPEIDKSTRELSKIKIFEMVINPIDDQGAVFFAQEINRLKSELDYLDKAVLNAQIAEINRQRFVFLQKAIETNLECLENGRHLLNYLIGYEKEFPAERFSDAKKAFEKISKSEYSLNIEKEAEKVEVNYPDGSPKIRQFYKNKQLHGPSTYFSPEGKTLIESWFVNGKKEGRALSYYSSGALYSITRFHSGVSDGSQEYFYENGIRRSLLNYKAGELHGEVILYFPKGNPKREIHFLNGLQDGIERLWSATEKLQAECLYKNGKPNGASKYWNSSGVLQKEILYNDEGNVKEAKYFDAQGNPIDISQKNDNDDFFDLVTRQSNTLTNSIEEVYMQIEQIEPFLRAKEKEGSELKDLKKEFDEIKQKIVDLRELNKVMFKATGIDPETRQEPIWKTPTMQRKVQEVLGKVSESINVGLSEIQNSLITTLSIFVENEKNDTEKK